MHRQAFLFCLIKLPFSLIVFAQFSRNSGCLKRLPGNFKLKTRPKNMLK